MVIETDYNVLLRKWRDPIQISRSLVVRIVIICSGGELIA
jgi:hypothetical protein